MSLNSMENDNCRSRLHSKDTIRINLVNNTLAVLYKIMFIFLKPFKKGEDSAVRKRGLIWLI